MFRKILLGLIAALLVIGAIAFFNRKEIILHLVTNAGRVDVAPNRPVEWMQDPETAAAAASVRAPNVIFILADDLGINGRSDSARGLISLDDFGGVGFGLRRRKHPAGL